MEVKRCERGPRGYGLAYSCPEKESSIYYPIPINIIVAIARWFYHMFRYKYAIKMDAYCRGYIKGMNNGYREIKEQIERIYDTEDQQVQVKETNGYRMGKDHKS